MSRKLRRRIARVRREVEHLAAIADARAAEAEKPSPRRTFRPLSQAETAAIVGAGLLAALSRECDPGVR